MFTQLHKYIVSLFASGSAITGTDLGGGKFGVDVNLAGGSVTVTGGATEAKQDVGNSSLGSIDTKLTGVALAANQLADGHNVIDASKLVPEIHDYIGLTYVAAGNGAGEIETATFKTGGGAGTTVATLTLTYDASNRIATVTRS